MFIKKKCTRLERIKKLAHLNFCEALLAEINDHGFLRLDQLARLAQCTEQDLQDLVLLIIYFLKPIIDAFANSILKRRKGEFLLRPWINSTSGQSYLFTAQRGNFEKRPHTNLKKQSKTQSKKDTRQKLKMKSAKQLELLSLARSGKFQTLEPPYQVSTSLQLVNTGYIHPTEFYHSEHNLFPVGYKAIRLHNSMVRRNVKTEYTCEIMDGGQKPIYKVTCAENPNSPIVRDSSTGCWIYICHKINEIAERKKVKVTISGTERFGLIDQRVVPLLEGLPNAEKCKRYVFKSAQYLQSRK